VCVTQESVITKRSQNHSDHSTWWYWSYCYYATEYLWSYGCEFVP